jgi:FAD/FMN-containing dehydrogenase
MDLTPVSPAQDAEALRARVRGAVAAPDDPDYDKLRASWNLTFDQRPSLVVEALDGDDVVAALRFARERELTVAVQCTGHGCGEVCAGGLLVRTSRLREVRVDPATRIAHVGAGARWTDVLPVTAATGLAPLVGLNPHVGTVGYALGGGLGWFSRAFGLAVNSVRALEVVSPEGIRQRVDDEHEPDLFWALRGASSNFGIVLAMEIELVPIPEDGLFGGMVAYPGERAADVVAAYGEWIFDLPELVTSNCAVVRLPSLSSVPEPLRGVPAVIVSACALADASVATDLLAPIRELGDPLLDTFRTLTIADLGSVAMEPVDPLPTQGHSAIVAELTPELEELLASTAQGEQPFVTVEARHIGGAVTRMETGCPIARPSGDVLLHAEVVVGPGPGGAAAAAALARFAAAVRPHATGELLPTFLGELETGAERLAQAYTAEGRRRLAILKRRYDPHHRFRFGRCVDVSWALDD